VDIDEILRLAATPPVTAWHDAQVRKGLRRLEQDHHKLLSAGHDPAEGLELSDPLRDTDDEAARIARQAELAGLGTFTWTAKTNLLSWSSRLATMLGFPPEVTTPSVARCLERVHSQDRPRVGQLLREAWRTTSTTEIQHRIVRDGDEIRHLHSFVEVLLDDANTPVGLVGTAQDVTELVRNQQELERVNKRLETIISMVGESLADYDPHTGLLSRRRFVNELDRAVEHGPGVVLLLGLAGLGEVNRAQGAEGGDRLVEQVATALKLVIEAPGHLLARVGGTEFAVLIPGVSMGSGADIAKRLLDVVHTRYLSAGRQRLDGRVGLVEYDQGRPESGEDLLIDADLALYEARDTGKDLVSGPLHATRSERRLQWRDRVEQAIRRDRFELHAQPILELATSRVTRHELLLRLTEGNELVTPSSFLPTVERLGIIGKIDRYVVGQAVELLAEAPADLHLQINISGGSVGDERFATFIEERLDHYRVDPARLTFELTETALIGNVTAARAFADRLRGLGCQLALDDFGSGYASLTYLRSLPFDLVKIDGELVKNLTSNKCDQVIVESIARMCMELGIRTVAEYIEDAGTLEQVRAYGIDFAQGWAVGRPAPVQNLLGRPEAERPTARHRTA
jgi:diguanylate cyclase (GGDEF)-like protein